MKAIIKISAAISVLLSLCCCGKGLKKETVTFRDNLKADVYYRTDVATEGARPVFIWSFGGGWESGTREIDPETPLYKMMLEEGFAVVSIDYRLGVKEAKEKGKMAREDIKAGNSSLNWTSLEAAMAVRNAIFTAVEDLYDATSFFVENAASWNIDTTKFIIGGGSAGAINSINAEYLRCNGSSLASEHLPEGFRYAGVFGGACSVWTEGTDSLSWGSAPCPVIMFHGSGDPTVPYGRLDMGIGALNGSSLIAASLRDIRSPYVLFSGEGYDHVLSGIPATDYAYEVIGYIKRLIFKGEKVAVETHEADYDGPKNLIRLFMDTMGLTEDQVKEEISKALKQQ